MKKNAFEKTMDKIDKQMSVENRKGDFNRARSVAVGTSFGGVSELMMRTNDGRTIWAVLQPVEVVELIHQLAANIGCHIHIQPRNDFSSWRNWRVSPEEKKHLNNHPPFVNDMAPHNQVGAQLSPPEQQPGLQPAMMARSESNEQTVATQKTVGRKRTKRAAAAA